MFKIMVALAYEYWDESKITAISLFLPGNFIAGIIMGTYTSTIL